MTNHMLLIRESCALYWKTRVKTISSHNKKLKSKHKGFPEMHDVYLHKWHGWSQSVSHWHGRFYFISDLFLYYNLDNVHNSLTVQLYDYCSPPVKFLTFSKKRKTFLCNPLLSFIWIFISSISTAFADTEQLPHIIQRGCPRSQRTYLLFSSHSNATTRCSVAKWNLHKVINGLFLLKRPDAASCSMGGGQKELKNKEGK